MRMTIGLALIRFFTGVSLLMAGIGKWRGGWLQGPEEEGERWMLAKNLSQDRLPELAKVEWLGWYHGLVENTFIPHAGVFTYLVVFGEILIGAGFVAGLLTRTAALFAILMGATFFLLGVTDAPLYTQLGFTNAACTLIVLAIVILLTDAGRRFGVDGKLRGVD